MVSISFLYIQSPISTSKSGIVSQFHQITMLYFLSFLPSTISPQAVTKTICINEYIVNKSTKWFLLV